MPEPTDEAIRDLCRARTDAIDDLRRSRFRRKAFLLRHGYRYQGKANWSQPHMRYLRELVLSHPAMKTILEEYLQGIDAAHLTAHHFHEFGVLMLLEQQINEGFAGDEGIFDLMGHAGGQGADIGQPIELLEAPFELPGRGQVLEHERNARILPA